jgi:cytochrome P450
MYDRGWNGANQDVDLAVVEGVEQRFLTTDANDDAGVRSGRASGGNGLGGRQNGAPGERAPVVISRYADVLKVLRSANVSRNIDESAQDFTDTEREMRSLRLSNAGARSMLNLDPPDHTRLRGLVSKAFTPKAVAQLRPRIEQLVNEALAPARATGSIELNSALAFPLPFQVIAEMLDLPTERVTELRSWSEVLTFALEPTSTAVDTAAAATTAQTMIMFLIDVIEDRRRNLHDDLLSFDAPVQNTVRVPLADITLESGGVLKAGRRVITLLGAANHDDELFETPEELHLDRQGAARHLSFATGIHHCLGASLAKLEAQIALGTMIGTFPEWTLTSPPRWRDRLTIRGVDELHVKLC